jgi:hypothetical protein
MAPLYDEILSFSPKMAFRILTLKPSRKDNKPISCTLTTHVLDDKTPAFEALSYCWGPLTDPLSVTCNGVEVHVMQNLDVALRKLRHIRKRRLLWIDALCINQASKRRHPRCFLYPFQFCFQRTL